MTTTTRPVRPLVALLSAMALVALFVALSWPFRAPHRAFEAFASDLARGAYASATARLTPPSHLALQGDGSLLATDRHRRSKTIAAAQLPFAVAEPQTPSDDPNSTLTMVALGPAQNGELSHPAVQLRVTHAQGGLHIDGIQ